jgi:hypothetical protein
MTLSQPNFMPKPRFLPIANHIFEPTMTNKLSLMQPFSELRAPHLTLLLKNPFSFKYLFLSIFVHRSVSPLSNLIIHFDNKHLFINLVLVNPKPPKSLGLASPFYHMVFLFFLPRVPIKISSSRIHFVMNLLRQQINSHGIVRYGTQTALNQNGLPSR